MEVTEYLKLRDYLELNLASYPYLSTISTSTISTPSLLSRQLWLF